jgi:hypothetical protein
MLTAAITLHSVFAEDGERAKCSAEVAELVNWLPEDSETPVVYRHPIVLPAADDDTAKPDAEQGKERDIDKVMALLWAAPSFLPNEKYYKLLEGKKVANDPLWRTHAAARKEYLLNHLY